jgi:chemotaxis protein methyltransferase CheR
VPSSLRGNGSLFIEIISHSRGSGQLGGFAQIHLRDASYLTDLAKETSIVGLSFGFGSNGNMEGSSGPLGLKPPKSRTLETNRGWLTRNLGLGYGRGISGLKFPEKDPILTFEGMFPEGEEEGGEEEIMVRGWMQKAEVTSGLSPLELTDQEFSRLSKLVYETCGINLHRGKRELLRARLSKRIRELGFGSFGDYYRYLCSDPTGQELIKMLDHITTNLSRFFREEAHFKFLEEEFYPGFKEQVARGVRGPRLRIWSAACATGEEPYSIVMHAMMNLSSIPELDLRVLATDISTRALEKASKGIYSMEKISEVPQELRRRFFLKGTGPWDGTMKVKREVRQRVVFQRHNLLDPAPLDEDVDIVFCRNVLIYFDRETQRRVLERVVEPLVRGGYLLVGHAESINGAISHLRYIKPAIYRKL